MLSDFLILEDYYGTPECALFYEDLSRKYGLSAIRKALSGGYLASRRIRCGPDCGRLMYWLTDKGRQKAAQNPVGGVLAP